MAGLNKLMVGLSAAMVLWGSAAWAQQDSEPAPLPGAGAVQSAPDLERSRGSSIPCEKKIFELNANSNAAPYGPDMPKGAVISAGFNESQRNKSFGHTFTLTRTGECCVCLGARLSVSFKALQNGASATSSDAGNDGAGVVHNGQVVPGSSGPIWGGPVTLGQTKTITYNVPCKVIESGRVSFYAQDDTAVTSMKLQIAGCCIRGPKLP